MRHETTDPSKTGAALVVGGGIGGMQAALDLTAAGIKVYLVDNKPSIGGVMAQLDKTFPTDDCAMCNMAPRLVEIARNKDIEVRTLSEIDKIEGEPGNLRVTLRKRARYVDEQRCVGCGACEEVCPIKIPDEYNLRLKETRTIYRSYPQAVPSSYVIEKRGQAPCRYSCPAGQKAQGYIALIRGRRFEDAYHVILRDNPLPSVCGRVCKRYCEDACTRARVDKPVAVMELKRFIADWAYEKKLARKKPEPTEENSRNASKRVAVVGSGPAGLTAARDLSDLGYSVTILEALPEPGGMMWAGIPEFRVPRERLQWDIQNILSADIELRTDCRVESIDSLLQEGFDAVFIAIGMHGGKKLHIPGHDLPDVILCTDFLRKVAMGEDIELKDSVLVLGGGDVAMDVARTAVRRGAKNVSVACLESREKMPADPVEVQAAEQEGVAVFPARSFLEITSNGGDIRGVRCIRVDFRDFDQDGKPDMDLLRGTEHTIEAATVIFAIGQAAEIPFTDEGIELTKAGTIKIDVETLATSKPGVFAGGDVVTGTRFIVDAIGAGHRAARSIDLYLNGKELTPTAPPPAKVELTDEQIRKSIRSDGQHHVPGSLSDEETKRSVAECHQGYTEEAALAAAERCLECGICSECLLCEEMCETGAIDHQMPKEELEQLDVGAVVLSPGYSIFDAGLKESLGYGRYPNVITSLEFERILSPSGPFAGEALRPSDRKEPKKIAFIQCVGSRDHDRDYCSSVCCMYATKQAIIGKEHLGEDLDCTIFYMDMRAFGKGFEEYYERAKRLGVKYIRCRPAAVEEDPNTRNLRIAYLTAEEKVTSSEYDLVVLSVGLQPPTSARQIADIFGIQLNEFGFCQTPVFRPVHTTRDGVYVSGAFTEPKDIPETVMQASGASSQVLGLLRDVRGSLIKPKEYPPEIDVTGQEPRVGIFVCQCGKNIGGIVDVPEVLEYAKTLPEVVHVEDNLYTCSQDTQELIKKTIREQQLNRVVVAACTPRTHQPLFEDTIREVGLNPYLFEMANIRNQCSWVHMHEPQKATEKAKDLVRMAVAKARMLEPLHGKSVKVEKTALVIGGGASGMTAATELAAHGVDVYLVEREGRLGGYLNRIHYLLNGERPQEALRSLIGRVEQDERIHVFTEAKIESIAGSVGNFTTCVATAEETRDLRHGVVVVATGAKEYRPKEYLYGEDERVMTQLELEEHLAKGGGWLEAKGKSPPKTVVMIQCVGSRDEERPYCSRICCSEAMKNALKIKELSPSTHVYVLYRDIRTYGFKESYYTEARRQGVIFLRYENESKPKISTKGRVLQVEVVDQTLQAPIGITADFIVLAAGIVPDEGNEPLGKALKVSLDNHGFFLEAHMKLRPIDFATDGVYLCGLAHSAKGIDEAIVQAQAAASRAASVLWKDEIEMDASTSHVVDENCDGCAYCVGTCPYKAITLLEYMFDGALKKVVDTDESACKGCGSCQATCPKEGIYISGFKLEQIAAQVNAALGVMQ